MSRGRMDLVPSDAVRSETSDMHARARDQDRELQELQRALKELDKRMAEDHREKQLLDEAAMLADLQKQKLERPGDRLAASRLDPEIAARLQDLRNQHEMEKRATAAPKGRRDAGQSLVERLATATQHHEEKLRRLAELQAELQETKDITHWEVMQGGPASKRDIFAVENRLRELKATLAQLDDEQRIQKQISGQKTEQIEQLSQQMEELTSVQGKAEEYKALLKQKATEKQELLEDMKTLQRIHAKKETLLRDLKHGQERSDPAMMRALDADKRVLQHEIQRHADLRRGNDKTIQAQHQRGLMLEGKLRSLAAALKSLKRHLPPDDPSIAHYRPGVPPDELEVPVELFDQVQRDLEEARRGLEMKDRLMLEKDAMVEALEKKVEIHGHAKRSMLRRLRLERVDMERERDRYQQQLYSAESEQRRRMQHLSSWKDVGATGGY
eukprot:TRINITY_DN10670_c0_g1_i1.p1 TRINITY_DN10670_c0_g1~~TRINITY_DN10670_c0_g1_i1.p1  ORF type:complete len:486 (+),score=178.92 TRINITY_DN10670_c0_g1_i1:133-1458(+)